MTPTEIWLRLMQVGDLCGDRWLNTEQWLSQNQEYTPDALQHIGLTAAQTRRFFHSRRVKLSEPFPGLLHRIII